MHSPFQKLENIVNQRTNAVVVDDPVKPENKTIFVQIGVLPALFGTYFVNGALFSGSRISAFRFMTCRSVSIFIIYSN